MPAHREQHSVLPDTEHKGLVPGVTLAGNCMNSRSDLCQSHSLAEQRCPATDGWTTGHVHCLGGQPGGLQNAQRVEGCN